MARRKKTNQPQTPSESAANPIAVKILTSGLFYAIVITIIVGGIPFGIGKYIELNSPGPFDSGAYVYSAKHLLDGAKMGVDEIPSARPGTLIANLIGVKLFGFNDVGPKIVQMLLQLSAMIFMFTTVRKVFGSAAAVLSTTAAAIYLSAPVIAKFGNVKEQFMIAFMICAACAFIWYAATEKKAWLILCGFFALQPFYFKPTGMSVVFAVILYIITTNSFNRKWLKLWQELGLFLCGYAAGMLIPAGLFIWQDSFPKLLRTFPPVAIALGAGLLILTGIPIAIIHLGNRKDIAGIKKIPQWAWGVAVAVILLVLIGTQWNRVMAAAGIGGGYTRKSWEAIDMEKLGPQVFRYYKAVSVPMLMAIGSIIAAALTIIWKWRKKDKSECVQLTLAGMLAVWWILDTAFVWLSPRSYEQYYLPLCASGAMCGSYLVWCWHEKMKTAVTKIPYIIAGGVVTLVLLILTLPVFTGLRYSPDNNTDYMKVYGHKRRGFAESLKQVKANKQGAFPWQKIGDHIRTHSTEKDGIYVWGWVPGIYVRAQRLSPVSKAFDGNMHITPPQTLAGQVNGIVKQMKAAPPKFIVDSRKRHFPFNRPQLELWPIVPPKMFGNEKPRFLRNLPQEVAAYEATWYKVLEKQVEPDEAKRFEAMKPFRDYVMNNYRIAGQYGDHILFERK